MSEESQKEILERIKKLEDRLDKLVKLLEIQVKGISE